MDISLLREVLVGRSRGHGFYPLEDEQGCVEEYIYWPRLELIGASPTRVLKTTKLPLKPRLFLMGLDRSGKSSISSVLVHRQAPMPTTPSTVINPLARATILSFLDLEIWDFPAPSNYFSTGDIYDRIFGNSTALIWVIDAEIEHITTSCAAANAFCYILNNSQDALNISMNIFIHKSDTLSADHTEAVYRNIQQTVLNELAGFGYDRPPVEFHLTNIYNNSIHLAVSRVVQKSIPNLPVLETILSTFCSNCGLKKVFLFDVTSRLFIATDSIPVTQAAYNLCTEYIDTIIECMRLYEEDEDDDDEDDANWLLMESEGQYLYLVQISWNLSLTCILGERRPEEQRARINAYAKVLREAIEDFFGPLFDAEEAAEAEEDEEMEEEEELEKEKMEE